MVKNIFFYYPQLFPILWLISRRTFSLEVKKSPDFFACEIESKKKIEIRYSNVVLMSFNYRGGKIMNYNNIPKHLKEMSKRFSFFIECPPPRCHSEEQKGVGILTRKIAA